MTNQAIHHITVCEKGSFWGTTNYPTTPEDIDMLFEHLRANDVRKIGLFVHGGLVNEDLGMQAVKNINAHVFSLVNSYGIGFVWKTGLLETLQNNLSKVHKTKLFKKLLVKILKKAGAKLGFGLEGKGIQEMSDVEILTELEKGEPFQEMKDNSKGVEALSSEPNFDLMQRELDAQFKRELMSDPEVIRLYEDDEQNFWIRNETDAEQQEAIAKGIPWLTIAKALAMITFRMIRRKYIGQFHGFHATAVEEIMRELALADLAEFVWTGMKTKAEAMWMDHKGTKPNEMFVGTYFLDKLNDYFEENELTIDLVAHSAGAVVTCHLFERIKEKDLNIRFNNIIFLAPACSVQVFHDLFLPHKNLYGRFRMFTMRDEYEARDRLVDSLRVNIYPSSLLYFVSGVCEPEVDMPILGMERYYSRSDPYADDQLMKVGDYINQNGEERVTWSLSEENSPEGMRTQSRDHGFFDNDPETLESLRYILK